MTDQLDVVDQALRDVWSIPDAYTFEEVPQRLLDAIERRGYAVIPKEDLIRVEELDALFELQWKRVREASNAWQEAHPGNETVWPDLGHLLEWLLENRHALIAAFHAMEAHAKWTVKELSGATTVEDATRHVAAFDALLDATVKAGVAAGILKEHV